MFFDKNGRYSATASRCSIVFLLASSLLGCNSTPVNGDEETTNSTLVSLPVLVKNDAAVPNMPDISEGVTIPETIKTEAPLKKPQKRKKKAIEAYVIPNDLIQQRVCQNNVAVNYRLPDTNGYKSKFSAKLQAQANVIDVSPNDERLKLQIVGWYSTNKTLQQWKPHLSESPNADAFSLKNGTVFWDDKKNWFKCK